jgi:hypothetical protein
MTPLKLLVLRSNEVKLVKAPIPVGTSPLRWLFERSSVLKHVQLLSSGGLIPARFYWRGQVQSGWWSDLSNLAGFQWDY